MESPWAEWLAEPLPRVVPTELTIGGRIRAEHDDFEVEEIPAYPPSGEGDHLFLWIEKRGKNTQEVIELLARQLRIPDQEVGTAGMKDRHAVTRQYVSVPRAAVPDGHEFQLGDDVRVLSKGWHGNKLRTGHLHGNRFRLVVRDPGPDAFAKATAGAELLRGHGVPNFYGEQRFGRDCSTVLLCLELLRKGKDSRRVRRGLIRLALSSVQSVLFNRVLVDRMESKLLHQVVLGDLMQVAPAGGFFTVEDVPCEQARLEAGEIVLTGPMFGRKMRQPTAEAAARELRVLELAGLDPESFRGHGKLLDGTRRQLLIRLEELEVAEHPHGVQFSFVLPAGAYATVVLRELMGERSAEPPTESGEVSAD